MTDDTLTPKPIDNVIEFANAQDLKTPRKNNKRPKGAGIARVKQIQDMCRSEIKRSDAGQCTDSESMFASMLVSGASMADAYEQAFPENCYTYGDNKQITGKISYHAMFDRGNRLAREAHIRAKVITLLEQEEVEVSHTSRRLDNMILKSLEKEATDPRNNASARISALGKLQQHRAVQVSEAQQAERAKRDLAPDELLEQISARIKQFTPKQ